MQLTRQLNRDQLEEYTRLKNSQNGMDQKIYDQTLRYYIQYRSNTGHISLDKLQLTFKTALFMAQKSQNIENLKGERMTLPSLTLSHLLKVHQLDQVMITLKDFSRNVKIQDKQAAVDLTNLIKEISFLITFHKKFEKSIEKLEMKERHPENKEDYLKNWMSFAWILYILAKNNVLLRCLELIENTCMMAHMIAFMISFSWDYLIPKAILKQQKRINEHSSLKEVMPIIRDKVLQMFSIKTMDIYASNARQFEKYFEQQLQKKGIIKSSPNNADFLSPQLLSINYRRIDKFYEKNMDHNNLDQRIFFKERIANLTPSKFTPFARQGYANKGRKMNNDTTIKQNFSSHRILNYQMIDKVETNIKNGNEGINMNKLPKAVLISPSSTMKVPLICSTPITMGMEMFNYVSQKARKFKQIFNQGQTIKRPLESYVVKYIEVLYEKGKKDFDKKTKQLRLQLIYSLFKLALQEYLSQHPNQKDNQQLYRALMAMSIQIVLFVCNSSLTFEDVQEELGAQSFQLWKACDFYLKFDRTMPSALKLHLLDIDVSLISQKIWRDEENVQKIKKCVSSEKNNQLKRGDFTEKLLRRVLHQSAFQVKQICSSLKIEENITEIIYETMKYIISEHTELLFGRNLDQFIMCSIFAISRKQKLDIKFTEIIDVYQQTNPHNKQIHDLIIYKIPWNDKAINLITFYNEIYIKPLKQSILNLKTIVSQSKKMFNPTSVMQSPLKDILPRELNKKNGRKVTKDGNTNLLVAYTDSPMLKHQPISLRAQNLQSRKVIDFDQEQEYFKNTQQQKKTKEYEKISPKNNANAPIELTKKYSGNMQNMQNIPWKPQQNIQYQNNQGIAINGFTPTRLNKNGPMLNYELNQFSTNPTPSTKSGHNNPKLLMISGLNKGRANY